MYMEGAKCAHTDFNGSNDYIVAVLASRTGLCADRRTWNVTLSFPGLRGSSEVIIPMLPIMGKRLKMVNI
jgi:hypothetical protein